jgi:flagellar assembly factor FliW
MLDNINKAFLVISPFQIVPDYQPDITAEDVEYLGLDTPADALVVNIVTLRNGGGATVNLKAPVVINRHTLVGKQVIPNNVASLAVCHPLPVA